MNLASPLKSLQKLRIFLGSVFPVLAKVPDPTPAIERWVARHPRLERAWQKIIGSPLKGHAQEAASTVVGTTRDDLLDWRTQPGESLPMLRGGVLVAGILALLVPLSVRFDWWPVPLTAITGNPDGAVGSWTIALWLAASSIAWPSLLTGTATANRVAFLPALTLYLYLSAAGIASLPKSWWSLPVSLAGLLAAVLCEVRAAPTRVGRVVAPLVAGGLIGFLTMVVIPLAPWYRGRLVAATIAVGVPLAGVIALAGWGGRRWLSRQPHHAGTILPVAFAIMVGLLATTCTALAVRGGLAVPAQWLHGVSVQVTGWLWPFYYFIGVGVVFKVLRQTKTYHRLVREFVPERAVVPLTVSVLVVATAVTWAQGVVETPGIPWPNWLAAPAYWLTRTLWVNSGYVTHATLESMRWVSLALLLLAVWGMWKRRMDVASASGLQVTFLVCWLGISEYHFEFAGLRRSATGSALTLFVFVVFVLWLSHRTLMKSMAAHTAWWPRTARAALYGAALIFIVLPLHVRVSLHEPRIADEVFLYLFEGVLNFGVPFYLFVYASRRFAVLPLSPQACAGLLMAGGVVAALLVAGDHVVLAGSPRGAWEVATARAAAYLEGQAPVPDITPLPVWWLGLRAVVGVLCISGVGALARRLTTAPGLRPAAAVFASVSLATGVACFSNRVLDLPLLPMRWALVITPEVRSSTLDARFVALQLTWLLPAMLLAWVATGDRSWRKGGSALVAAVALQWALAVAWPRAEPWVRSADLFAIVTFLAVVLFLLLVVGLRQRLDAMLMRVPETGEERTLPVQLVVGREARVAAMALVLGAVALGGWRAWTRRLVAAAPVAGVPVPARWSPVGAAGVTSDASFAYPSVRGTIPRLWILRHPVTDTSALLQEGAGRMVSGLADVTLTGTERWSQHARGAQALDFTWNRVPGDSNTFVSGTLAVAPVGRDSAVSLLVTYSLGDLHRRWDLARILATLPRH